MLSNTVEISVREYEELIRCERIIEALKSVGIEDWCGYEEAMVTVNEEVED